MKFYQLAAVAALAASSTAQAAPMGGGGVETRCGWIANPTPGNWWLDDRDAEWTLSVQGGYQAQGAELPDFSGGRWVITNAGGHGYGCACLTALFDHATKQVVDIKAVKQRPLRQCRNDKRLKRPD